MNIFAITASAVLAMGSPHTATLSHQGEDHAVTYTPKVAVEYRTVGMSAGPRPSTERCRWVGTVAVDRHLHDDQGRRLTKTLDAVHRMEGSRHGACAPARAAIDQEIAARHDEVTAHVQRVAAADRDAALADLRTGRQFASN
ncbi:MAG: hypothetical protein PGN09_07265 [Sphingomonas fennica]